MQEFLAGIEEMSSMNAFHLTYITKVYYALRVLSSKVKSHKKASIR